MSKVLPKWEYKMLTIPSNDVMKTLNFEGIKGWEAFTMNSQFGTTAIFFKRKLED